MKLSFEQFQELRSLHMYHPQATVADIMAAFDVSDTRAERLLAEYNAIEHSLEHPVATEQGIPVYDRGSMAVMMIEAAVTVLLGYPMGLDASSAEQAAARASIPAHIIVWGFAEYLGGFVPASGGAVAIVRGNRVTGAVAGGDPAYSEFVRCSQRHEPETRNIGGGVGAWREIPDEAGIQQAIKNIAQAIRAGE